MNKDDVKEILNSLKTISNTKQEKHIPITREERNILIKEYITNKIQKLRKLYGVNLSQEKINNVINIYINKEDSLEDIYIEINTQFNSIISTVKKEHQELNEATAQLKSFPKSNPYFGEVYKKYIIHIFNIYEEIANSNLSEEQKRTEFQTQLVDYIAKNTDEMNNFILQQTTDERLISLSSTELHRGADTLNFDTVKNLYNTFINDINIVSNDYEGKMYCTVLNNQNIFETPILDENNNVCINPNIKYNFDMLKETYDFAKKHGKQIKFHTFLWHAAIPENLKKEIGEVTDPSLKRKMALTFLQDYASNLATFIKENNYDLRQIEALNEIANDNLNGDTLRDSWWKDTIGTNPENGDEYYIDVLKIVRKNFPDTEILYNEYNEFIEDKNSKICKIIEYVKSVEQRDGITLLDGIGLQAHYSDYIKVYQRPLKSIDIVNSAVNLQKTCGNKKIYITEFDFLDFQKNGTKEQLEQVFLETYSKISNGFIIWGNSDSLTWYHCIDKEGKPMNAQIINSEGLPKEIYEQYRQAFLKPDITFQKIGQETTQTVLANPQEDIVAMSNLKEEHAKLKKLVETGVLIPGIYTGTVGNITYRPISQKEYLEKINKGHIQGLAYNTKTMGRGIFTLNTTGKIINFKGVDSQLENKDNFAVQTTEARIENVNSQDSYGINIIYFTDRNNKDPKGKIRLEFRTKGASQYQNLLIEKLKRDDIQRKDTKKLIKLPELDMPEPLSSEMCEKFSLPRVLEMTEEFLGSIQPGSYAEYCLTELKKQNINITHRNQLWQEYFQEYYPEKMKDNPDLLETVKKEDSTYGLGAIFAQTTRKLDNPFRIMELNEYIKNKDIEAVRAIIEYSQSRCDGELLKDYAKISAKNVAGFMNLNLAINNFEHRQDFPLSGEICDDAYDYIGNSATAKFYYQTYLFATNMKIIEDAYKILGKEVPKGYQETFLETFYESLNNKENFKSCFRNENPMEQISRFDNAEKNFYEMDSYIIDLREKAKKVWVDKNLPTQKKHPDTNDDLDER